MLNKHILHVWDIWLSSYGQLIVIESKKNFIEKIVIESNVMCAAMH